MGNNECDILHGDLPQARLVSICPGEDHFRALRLGVAGPPDAAPHALCAIRLDVQNVLSAINPRLHFHEVPTCLFIDAQAEVNKCIDRLPRFANSSDCPSAHSQFSGCKRHESRSSAPAVFLRILNGLHPVGGMNINKQLLKDYGGKLDIRRLARDGSRFDLGRRLDHERRREAEADLAVCNLECCISDRGEPWPDPAKPFFFRAPPVAAELLAGLGIAAVTLANNHALDYGEVALRDTLRHLDDAGIAHVGAGTSLAEARMPAMLEAAGSRVGLVGLADHPEDFAAAEHRPGIAYADLRHGVPAWVTDAVAGCDVDVLVATPHWGPNMTTEPVPHVQAAAPALVDAGAALVAGHSAHCFHGVAPLGDSLACYDLGDFVDDYAVHPARRNDLGLLWLVDVDGGRPRRLEAVPLALDYCFTRVAAGDEAAWIRWRFRKACAAFGVEAREEGGRLVAERG